MKHNVVLFTLQGVRNEGHLVTYERRSIQCASANIMLRNYYVFSKFGKLWEVFQKFANIMFRKYYVFRPTTVEDF